MVPPAGVRGDDMAGFVQIIEFKTSRIGEIEALLDEMRAQREADGASSVRQATFTADRDRPGYYLSVIEFDSYESAMENSTRPETGRWPSCVRGRRSSTTWT
jgi:hypothetical protein